MIDPPKIMGELKTNTAVFLGPTLPRERARLLLDADYFPPARMGDIYGLLATEIETIVLVDGLFHTTAAIWQREILAALACGIRVVGSASMGALRAAELAPFGMEGAGLVYQWYRMGAIDGDDEVALIHGDESRAFQPISEPMVNIRYNLLQAVSEGWLCPSKAQEFIKEMKSIWFGERTYAHLFNSQNFFALQPSQQQGLTQCLTQRAIDIKAHDAWSTLQALAVSKCFSRGQSLPIAEESRYFKPAAWAMRGFRGKDGTWVKGSQVLERAQRDQQDCVRRIREEARRFYIRLWAKDRGVTCPAAYHAFFDRWLEQRQVFPHDLGQWCQFNGLRVAELESLLQDHALVDYLLNRELVSSNHGKPFVSILMAIARARAVGESKDVEAKGAVEMGFLASFAKEHGINPSNELLESTTKKAFKGYGRDALEQCFAVRAFSASDRHGFFADLARCRFLIEKRPRFFGFTSWHASLALLKNLQYYGEAGRLAAAITQEANHE